MQVGLTMDRIPDKLTGGDRRSIGRADEVVEEILDDPSLFHELIRGMQTDDPVIRMRAADAAEKISVRHPEYLQPHKNILIKQIAHIDQQEIRWHMAQIFPRLDVIAEEQAEIVKILKQYLQDNSRIVRTFTLQALADFALRDAKLHREVLDLLAEHAESGSPAVKSRATTLLTVLRSAK